MAKKILLIEDNQAVRENILEILQLDNYEAIGAENGKIGVQMAVTEMPDLIICDIMMPELDGYGVLHMLSKAPETAAIPFIFLTAKAERTDFRKGMEMGADDYITKPFDDIELLNAIEMRLKKNELLRTEFASNIAGISEFLNQANQTGKIKLTSNEREVQGFKKKQMIYRQGQRPANLFFISKGKVKTFKINDDGKELITEIYKEGDFMGYIPLLDESIYQDNAEVLEDAEVMIIPKADFVSLISSDTTVARSFIKLLSQHLVEKEKKLLDLAYNSLRKRVADGLLQVYNKYKKDAVDSPRLEMSREDLAQFVGTATESLIRTLSDFKSEKLIEIKEGKISILDEAKLKNLLN